MEVMLIKIGFIGAGKVGFSLGKYFVNNGIQVSGYYSRSQNSAIEAADFTGTEHFSDLQDLIPVSDLIFITTPDDEIYNLWMSIKEMNIRERIICHASGSLSSNIFCDIEKSDAYPYSIHPIFPISDKYESYKFLNNAYFTIEGHEKHVNMLMDLFKAMGNNIIKLTRQDKVLYHLASVTVSNLFCGLMDRACSYLKEYGFEEKQAVEALYPLIISNINNIKAKGIVQALTGPVDRGDLGTVKRHMKAMPEEHRVAYRDLSQQLLNIAARKHGDRDYGDIKNYLGEEK